MLECNLYFLHYTLIALRKIFSSIINNINVLVFELMFLKLQDATLCRAGNRWHEKNDQRNAYKLYVIFI